MKTAFIIYIRAVGVYVLLTLPALIFPFMYVISLGYVLTFGWAAWFLFTIIYLVMQEFISDFDRKLFILFLAVVISVGFAYAMIGLSGSQNDIWQSEFMIFPGVAIIAGWISVSLSWKKIQRSAGLYKEENNHTVSY